nr:Uncharacterised protein [Raoultella sp. NCTC 9187]
MPILAFEVALSANSILIRAVNDISSATRLSLVNASGSPMPRRMANETSAGQQADQKHPAPADDAQQERGDKGGKQDS